MVHPMVKKMWKNRMKEDGPTHEDSRTEGEDTSLPPLVDTLKPSGLGSPQDPALQGSPPMPLMGDGLSTVGNQLGSAYSGPGRGEHRSPGVPKDLPQLKSQPMANFAADTIYSSQGGEIHDWSAIQSQLMSVSQGLGKMYSDLTSNIKRLDAEIINLKASVEQVAYYDTRNKKRKHAGSSTSNSDTPPMTHGLNSPRNQSFNNLQPGIGGQQHQVVATPTNNFFPAPFPYPVMMCWPFQGLENQQSAQMRHESNIRATGSGSMRPISSVETQLGSVHSGSAWQVQQAFPPGANIYQPAPQQMIYFQGASFQSSQGGVLRANDEIFQMFNLKWAEQIKQNQHLQQRIDFTQYELADYKIRFSKLEAELNNLKSTIATGEGLSGANISRNRNKKKKVNTSQDGNTQGSSRP